jgi:prepilin-type N-terminal cleavage/methylation domain-containing protein/prepilin-type processing-associated H-X9-DG protein
MKARGMTLTEMMFVIAIIAILAGIGYPLGMKLLGRARESACLTNLAGIGAALDVYMRDHGGRLPELRPGRASKKIDAPVLDTILLEYTKNDRLFCCPAGVKEFNKTGCSYFWNSALNGSTVADATFFNMRKSPETIPLVTDKEAWHPHATNILYADGSASNKIRFKIGNSQEKGR